MCTSLGNELILNLYCTVENIASFVFLLINAVSMFNTARSEVRLQKVYSVCVFFQSCLSKVFDLTDGGVSHYAWFPCEESQRHNWNAQYRLKVSKMLSGMTKRAQ